MSLAAFRCPAPTYLAAFDAFVANVEKRHRYLLTFKDGSHLVGVPIAHSTEEPTNPEVTFDVITAVDTYRLPFSLLAYAHQLIESGLRPSDGQIPVPEPCSGPVQRAKHQKLGILDSPRLLDEDLREAGGVFGLSVLYADIDHFKALNTAHTERVIDKTVLPEFQKLIADAVSHHGYAYAEGGDEIVVLLPNTSRAMAVAFAEDLRGMIEHHRFVIEDQHAGITLSIGVA